MALYTTSLYAQTTDCAFSVSGTTHREHGTEPLAFAVIAVPELDTTILSDDEGHYLIEQLCPGKYTFICSFLGFQPDTQQVVLTRNTGVFFHLHPEDCELEEVVVSPIHLLPSRQMETILVNHPTSTGNITRNVSGGSSLNTGANTAKPVFHGLHSNRLKIVENGIPIENQQWGAEHGLDLGSFENPTISMYPAFHHDAIGGVLSSYTSLNAARFEQFKHNREYHNNTYYLEHAVRGGVTSSFQSNGRSQLTSAYLQGNVKRLPIFAWKAFGGVGQGGDVHTPDYNLRNTGFGNYHYGYAAALDLGKCRTNVYYKNVVQQLGIFTGSHIGNTSDFEKAVKAERPNDVHTGSFSYLINGPFQQTQHEMFAARVTYEPQTNGRTLYQLNYSRQFNHRQEFDAHDLVTPDLDLNLTTHHTQLLMHYQLDSVKINQTATIGFTGMRQQNTWRYNPFIPNYVKDKAGVFVSYQNQQLGAKKGSTLNTAVLYDVDNTDVYILDQDQVQRKTLFFHAPAARMEWKSVISVREEEQSLRKWETSMVLGVATAWRAPAINELYSGGVHHSAASLDFGNPDLNKESSYKVYWKWFKLEATGHLAMTVHSNFISQYIYTAPTGNVLLTTRGAFPEFTYKQTDVLLSGIDLDWHRKINERWSSTAKTTWLQALDLIEKDGLIGIPANRLEEELTYQCWKQAQHTLDIRVKAAYFMKQFNSNLDFELVNPPKGYLLADALLSYTYTKTRDDRATPGTFRCLLSVNNVFNTRYRDYMNRNRFFADEMGRNITLTFEIPFTLTYKDNYQL